MTKFISKQKKKFSVNWVKGPHLQYKFSWTPVVNTQNACFQNNNFSYLKNFEQLLPGRSRKNTFLSTKLSKRIFASPACVLCIVNRKVYTFLSTTKIPNPIGFFSSRFLKRCAVRTDSLIYSCNIFCKRLEIDTCSSISSDFKKLDKVKRIIAFVYSLFYKNTLKLSNSLHIHKKKATLSKLHINSWYVIQWVFVYFWRGYKWMGRKKIYS